MCHCVSQVVAAVPGNTEASSYAAFVLSVLFSQVVPLVCEVIVHIQLLNKRWRHISQSYSSLINVIFLLIIIQ